MTVSGGFVFHFEYNATNWHLTTATLPVLCLKKSLTSQNDHPSGHADFARLIPQVVRHSFTRDNTDASHHKCEGSCRAERRWELDRVIHSQNSHHQRPYGDLDFDQHSGSILDKHKLLLRPVDFRHKTSSKQ